MYVFFSNCKQQKKASKLMSIRTKNNKVTFQFKDIEQRNNFIKFLLEYLSSHPDPQIRRIPTIDQYPQLNTFEFLDNINTGQNTSVNISFRSAQVPVFLFMVGNGNENSRNSFTTNINQRLSMTDLDINSKIQLSPVQSASVKENETKTSSLSMKQLPNSDIKAKNSDVDTENAKVTTNSTENNSMDQNANKQQMTNIPTDNDHDVQNNNTQENNTISNVYKFDSQNQQFLMTSDSYKTSYDHSNSNDNNTNITKTYSDTSSFESQQNKTARVHQIKLDQFRNNVRSRLNDVVDDLHNQSQQFDQTLDSISDSYSQKNRSSANLSQQNLTQTGNFQVHDVNVNDKNNFKKTVNINTENLDSSKIQPDYMQPISSSAHMKQLFEQMQKQHLLQMKEMETKFQYFVEENKFLKQQLSEIRQQQQQQQQDEKSNQQRKTMQTKSDLLYTRQSHMSRKHSFNYKSASPVRATMQARSPKTKRRIQSAKNKNQSATYLKNNRNYARNNSNLQKKKKKISASKRSLSPAGVEKTQLDALGILHAVFFLVILEYQLVLWDMIMMFVLLYELQIKK